MMMTLVGGLLSISRRKLTSQRLVLNKAKANTNLKYEQQSNFETMLKKSKICPVFFLFVPTESDR